MNNDSGARALFNCVRARPRAGWRDGPKYSEHRMNIGSLPSGAVGADGSSAGLGGLEREGRAHLGPISGGRLFVSRARELSRPDSASSKRAKR